MKIIYFVLFISALLWANDDIFDKSANLYIKGNLPEAARLIQTALQADPSDEKLRALLEKIREEMNKEKENQQDQQSQGQQKEDKQQEQEQGENGENNEQQKDEEKEQPGKEEQKEKEQKQAAQDEKDKENKEQEQKETQQAEETAEQINKDEAERILNALRADEKEAQKKKAPVRGTRRARGKDW